jgi:hypothetical protein
MRGSIMMDLLKLPVKAVTQRSDASGLPAPVPNSVLPPADRPLDWGHAVDAAAARLEESWVRPDATGHMLASGLAGELAATLCAYGMVAAEVDHMHGQESGSPISQPTLPK